jgi:aspartate kinase
MDVPAVSLTGAQVGILTDAEHTKAKVRTVSTERIRRELDAGNVVVVAGFQGVTHENDITTLGRGGSDATAVALAAVLKADVCEIYSDVDGVYTADPRCVGNARKIPVITYEEMMELASLGAQVLQNRAVQFAKRYSVPLHVRSSFNNTEGTMVVEKHENMEEIFVSGAALDMDEVKMTLRGVPDRPGIAARVFGAIAESNINVDMIVQNVSAEGRTDVSFTVSRSDMDDARRVTEKISADIGAEGVHSDADVAKISVVGVGMRSHSGVARKMFQALADREINIQMITTSEIKISCLIGESAGEDALRAVHDAFGLGEN